MEKTRVPKGGNYWCIEISMGVIEIVSYIDNRHYCDNRAYESGNYYCDKDEAECVAHKLQAVLKGAEVIEMPSEEEMKQNIENISYNIQKSYGETDEVYDAPIGACLDSAVKTMEYLKSKIIK